MMYVCTCPSQSEMSLLDMRVHSWAAASEMHRLGARPTAHAYSLASWYLECVIHRQLKVCDL